MSNIIKQQYKRNISRNLYIVLSLIVLLMMIFTTPVSSREVTFSPVGTWQSPAVGKHYSRVAVKGNVIYCLDTDGNIDVVNANDPANPSLTTSYSIANNGPASSLAVSGDYLYVAGENALHILDISTPDAPSAAGSYDMSYSGDRINRNIRVIGSYAYIATAFYPDWNTFSGQLAIINISSPATPVLISSTDTIAPMNALEVLGNKVYMAGGDHDYNKDEFIGEFHILDISDAEAPVSLSVTSCSRVISLQVANDHAFLCSTSILSDGIIRVYNVSDPAAPSEVTQTGYGDLKLITVGNTLYGVDGSGNLVIMDITTPSAPVTLSLLGFMFDGYVSKSYGMTVSGNFAYVVANQSGISIIDISTPASPVLTGNLGLVEPITKIALNNGHVYLAKKYEGLHAVDVSDKTAPTWKGKFYGSSAINVCTAGNHAYVSEGRTGLKIINIGNPSAPALTYTYSSSNYIQLARTQVNYLYLVDENLLKIMDVTDPEAPVTVGSYDALIPISGLFVRGNYAYITVGSEFRILDISNPESPVLTGSHSFFLYSPWRIHVSGNYAYLVLNWKFGWGNIEMVDISDPANPFPSGTVGVSQPYGFQVVGNFLYVANYSGLEVYNVSNPQASRLVGDYGLSGGAWDVKVQGDYVYLGGSNQLLILKQEKHTSGTPVLKLSRNNMHFSADEAGNFSGAQTVWVENTGGSLMLWTATPSESFIKLSPVAGSGNGQITVSVDVFGMSAGNYSGTIDVADRYAANSPQQINVTLTVKAGGTGIPFGEFATPLQGENVSSSIAVTGWVLDDIGIESVQLFRGKNENSLTYIGDATLVEGARPDVEAAYPNYPNNTKAGWGYMLLTNFLPGGNGTFTLHAIATDKEGNQVSLGSKTIHVDNANAIKPFGAIDTPTQGGTASGGNFINWGWALTPMPNSIPTDGSTISVWVDGINKGHPTYNVYREDIATLFPGYANSNGAVGYFYLDTTDFSNGVHTIQWTATDNAGNTDGIGSRYFTVANAGASDAPTSTARSYLSYADVPPAGSGNVEQIMVEPLGRLRLDLSKGVKWNGSCSIEGYQVIGNRLGPLPVGSHLNKEQPVLTWGVGPGFMGRFRMLFIMEDEAGKRTKREVEIHVIKRIKNKKQKGGQKLPGRL